MAVFEPSAGQVAEWDRRYVSEVLQRFPDDFARRVAAQFPDIPQERLREIAAEAANRVCV